MSSKIFLVIAAVCVTGTLTFDPCKIKADVRETICRDATAAVRFAFGVVKGDEEFFGSGAALHEEVTDRVTSLPLEIGPVDGPAVGYGEVLAVLGRLACGSWERLCSGCRRPASNSTGQRSSEDITVETSTKKTETSDSAFPIVPFPLEEEQGSTQLEYHTVPEIQCVCPTTSALPEPAPATPETATIIIICVAVSVAVALAVFGVWVWTLVKRVGVAEKDNRQLHRLLIGDAGHRMAPPVETFNIQAGTAGGPFDTGVKNFAQVPRRSPFATVSPARQYARYTGVPRFDPPPHLYSHISPPSSPHTFSTPLSHPRIPLPNSRRPIPWPQAGSESWLGF